MTNDISRIEDARPRRPGVSRKASWCAILLAAVALLFGSPAWAAEGAEPAADDAELATLQAELDRMSDQQLAELLKTETEVYEQVRSPRGRRPNKTFIDASGIDSVDTSSGNVTVRVPLGQSYQVGPLISYAFTAVHNSNAWDSVTMRCHSASNPEACTVVPPATFAVPNVSSNAGLGWEVHFGRLFAPELDLEHRPAGMSDFSRQLWPNRDGDNNQQLDDFSRWLYIAPDGTRHQLFELDDRPGEFAGKPVRYSKDGSFLRMKFAAPGVIHVEHPDGVVSVFKQTDFYPGTLFCDGNVTGCWRFERQIDPYGNQVSVSYARDWGKKKEIWTVSDSTGRKHYLTFSFDSHETGGGDGIEPYRTDAGDEWGDARTVLQSVDVAAFGGQRAVYQFKYDELTVTRGCPHDALRFQQDHPSGFSTLTTRVLDRIEVPDSQPWIFTTKTSPQAGSCDQLSGKLTKVEAPAQGAIGFQYGVWHYPTKCVYTTVDPGELDVDRQGRGISKRLTYAIDGSIESTTEYSSELYPPRSQLVASGANCSRANFRETIVKSQPVDGRYMKQKLYHAVTTGPRLPTENRPISSWQVTDNGLPFTKTERVEGEESKYRFLTKRIQECTGSGCTTKRSHYVRYTSQYRQRCETLEVDPGCFAIDPVVTARSVRYHDDNNKGITTLHKGYNGAGSFRQTDIWDNFASGPSQLLRTTTRYTATGATYQTPNDTTGYLEPGTITYLPDLSAKWILHPFSWRRTLYNGTTYRVDYEFNNKGLMTCLRQRQNAGAYGPQDSVVQLVYGNTVGTNAGMILQEIFRGGETANLSTASLCAGGGSTSNGSLYTINHGYQFLALSSSRYQGAPFETYSATIDKNTGLESATFDVAGQSTSHDYDRLGRPVSDIPAPSLKAASTHFTYYNNDGASPVAVTHWKDGGVELKKLKTVYDGFLRPIRELAWRPAGTSGSATAKSRRDLVYDPLGRLSKQTTWQNADSAFSTNKATLFQSYDIFDRAWKVTAADGEVQNRTFTGDRLSTSQVRVRTSEAGFAQVTTTTEKDAHGRTVRVSNPIHTTATVYDPYGRATSVTRSGGGESQTRSYGYDGRGVLLWERLPELGSTTANGTRNYRPDAMGNSRRAWGSGVDLTYSYDLAGRPTQVRETGGGRLWQEYSYANNNSGTNYRKGRLKQAVRHNYPTGIGHWTVTEDYEYRETLGKLSKTTVTAADIFNGFTDAVFETGFGYDKLGNLDWMSHPTCLSSMCSDGSTDRVAPSRVTTRTIVQGRTTRVESKRSSTIDLHALYSYHPNMQVAELDYRNGTQLVLGQGTNGMQRPGRLDLKRGSAVLWAAGNYRFDGAGNIWSVGADFYYYDQASRLLSGTNVHAGGARKEEYTYDAFDNVTSLRQDGGPVTQHVIETRSNRLLRDEHNSAQLTNLDYDAAGNMTQAGRRSDAQPIFRMEYDALDMQSAFTADFDGGGIEYQYLYIYGPGNYRLVTANAANGERTYKLRDKDGTILREYLVQGWGDYESSTSTGAAWLFQKDLVSGPSGTFASRNYQGTIYYLHPDHLGTPRIVTDAGGSVRGRHHYYPYGRKIPNGPQIQEPNVEFAGHESDPHSLSDYMRGRTYQEPYLRFATPDPARDGWNLYAYVSGNPLTFNDPSGLQQDAAASADSDCLTCGPNIAKEDLKNAARFALIALKEMVAAESSALNAAANELIENGMRIQNRAAHGAPGNLVDDQLDQVRYQNAHSASVRGEKMVAQGRETRAAAGRLSRWSARLRWAPVYVEAANYSINMVSSLMDEEIRSMTRHNLRDGVRPPTPNEQLACQKTACHF